MGDRFLVTGASGCIGAWVLRILLREGTHVVATDLVDDRSRLRLILEEEPTGRLRFAQADIRDLLRVRALVAEHEITHIVHLAGLQVPYCRSDPSLGAQVNVVGTVHVLEAAREFPGRIQGVALASSVAVFGPPARRGQEPLEDGAERAPETLYGAYKVAGEQAARVYWKDWSVPSVALRPYIVFGVGRDRGLTSDLTKAILAACAGRPFRIRFGGTVLVQFAEDVAKAFIRAARSAHRGAAACNLAGDAIDVGDFAERLKAAVPGAEIGFDAGAPLPFPHRLDDARLRSIIGDPPHTPFDRALSRTIDRFRSLLAEGRIDPDRQES
jgi:nucleoside-diphosphate-sugar epimerase